MNKEAALHLLSECLDETERIVFTKHAQERMAAWQVNGSEVLYCLGKGIITEGPFLNPRANWQFNVTRAARFLTVTVIVEDGTLVIRTVIKHKGRDRP
jgi:hypothetical protein